TPHGAAGESWRTLRAVGSRLRPLDASIVTTLQALAHWHNTHSRCPRCGAETEPVQGGWVRRCVSDGSDHFPRTDPSVIMSVIDDAGRLLLGRTIGWPDNQFSVLAGFVEPGESLEQAVVREVAEESGVEVTAVRYLGSQPWPFPASLMLGFTARAVTTDLHPEPTEMAEVRWVTRAEYAALLRGGEIRVPGEISIARRLIERWLGDDVDAVAGRPVLEGWRPAPT
ncbi:MAG: NAD(+) diphosphatase, partial [Candidatus Phosphoribacter sp.]